MLVPPENFSMVEDNIYRCSKLDAINISFLKSINLKSIIWINEEKPPRILGQFIEEQEINLFHMTNSGNLLEEDEITNVKYQEWMILKPSIISKAIERILDINNHNCLVMDTSEVIIGILRHIQRWNYSSILNEYRLYANKTSYKAEIFLELINLELVPNDQDVVDDKMVDETRSVASTASRSGSFDYGGDTGDADQQDTLACNHSCSRAIDIEHSANRAPQIGHTELHAERYGSASCKAQSPAIRRLSVEHHLRHTPPRRPSVALDGGGVEITSPAGAPPLSPMSSSSAPRLSISTSPQIPKNLLKMAEMRKHKKKQSHHHGTSQSQTHRDGGPSPPASPSSSPPAAVRQLPANLSTTALDTYSLTFPAHTAREAALHTAHAAAATAPGPTAYSLYAPRENSTQVRRPGRPGREVPTTMRVRLPPASSLPLWFLELRTLCEDPSIFPWRDSAV